MILHKHVHWPFLSQSCTVMNNGEHALCCSTAGHLSDLSSLDSMKTQLAPNANLLKDSASLNLKAVAAAEAAALSASWNATYVGKTVCDDSCPASKNKQCDDGRSGNGQVSSRPHGQAHCGRMPQRRRKRHFV